MARTKKEPEVTATAAAPEQAVAVPPPAASEPPPPDADPPKAVVRRKVLRRRDRERLEMAETNRSAKAIRLRSIEQLIRLVIGDDTSREGLRDTPSRVLKAWEVWGAGYRERPEDFLTVFEDGAENYDQLIVVSDIPIYSHCEHHLTPFFGTCTIAYLPDGRIVGLSKLVRVAQLFARRLQVQERLTQQIADAIERHLRPRAVGVMLACRHLCMESRGVQAVGTVTRTQALRGALLTDADLRAEFAALESPRTL